MCHEEAYLPAYYSQREGDLRGRGGFRTEATKMEGKLWKGFELMDVRFTGRILIT
jgi:hypothetical protein